MIKRNSIVRKWLISLSHMILGKYHKASCDGSMTGGPADPQGGGKTGGWGDDDNTSSALYGLKPGPSVEGVDWWIEQMERMRLEGGHS